MRAHTIAAVALAAWSKTALATPALASANGGSSDTVPNPPPASWTIPLPTPGEPCTAPASYGPTAFGDAPSRMIVSTPFTKSSTDTCPPGVLTLQASHDGAQWKNLATAHTSGAAGAVSVYAQHTCLSGTWSYRNVFVADDHSYKNTAPAVPFTC